MWKTILLAATTLATPELALAQRDHAEPRHVDVHYEQGRFGGWPANHGIWSWGDEILVGFGLGYYKSQRGIHHIDSQKSEEHLLARSLDGGETWSIENPGARGFLLPQGRSLHGSELPGVEIPEWREPAGGIDFSRPGFALTLRMVDNQKGPSRYYYTYDRGKTWSVPFRFPNLGTPGILARTDYQILGPDHVRVFLTAAKQNLREGRVICAESRDGGATWALLSHIGPEPEDGFSIMPASARLSEREYLVIARRRLSGKGKLEQYRSLDDARTWTLEPSPAEDLGVGNPPSLVHLADGRLALVYAFRGEPYSIRAKTSTDGGRSWGEERTLRDDGCSTDIGYVRSVQRPDGEIVSVYYFCDNSRGPDRYIAATIWSP